MAEHSVRKCDQPQSSTNSDTSDRVLEKLLFDGIPTEPSNSIFDAASWRGANTAAREAYQKELELKTKTMNALTSKFMSDRERHDKWKRDYMMKVNEEAKRKEEWAAERATKDNPVSTSTSDYIKRLQKARPRLISEIDHTSVEKIMDEMTALRDGKRLITLKQHEALKAQLKVKAKVRCLLDIIYDQGETALDVFVLTLESSAIGRRDLAQLLRGPNYQPAELTVQRSSEKEPTSDNRDHSRIAAVLELQKMQSEYGNFSYSVWTDKLLVHLEDDKARQNEKPLTDALSRVSKLLYNDRRFDAVVVSSDSLRGVLCSPAIGAKLEINRMQQTTGMYVVYHGDVHWVSVAHHFLSQPLRVMNQTSEYAKPVEAASQEISCRGIRIVFDNEEITTNDNLASKSMKAYPCLKHVPRDNRGRLLLYSVDVMIGQLPDGARLAIEDPQNQPFLCEVRQCSECKALGCAHDNPKVVYQIEEVLQPTIFSEKEYVFYDPNWDPKYDEYRNVRTLLPGGTVVDGVIEQAFVNCYLDNHCYNCALYISSTNGVSPRLGDSGSIWVTNSTSKAVAITVGKTKNPHGACGEVWVALFLFPCLQELCRQYNLSELRSVTGHWLVSCDKP